MVHDELVSILIPYYKHEKYIFNCLNSIIEDDYQNKEIIIIDDGSLDSVEKIIDSWKIENPSQKIFFRSRPNKGISKTFNELISMSNGNIIIFLASDDLLFNNTISERVGILKSNPEKLVLISDAYVINNDGEIINDSLLKDFHNVNINNYFIGDLLIEEIVLRFSISGPTSIINKEIYKLIGAYPLHLFSEDFYFYSMAAIRNKIMYTDLKVAKYRRHDENVSGGNPVILYDYIKIYIMLFSKKLVSVSLKLKILSRILFYSKLIFYEKIYFYDIVRNVNKIKKLFQKK